MGASVWVEIPLDKFSSHRPTDPLLSQSRLLGLDVAERALASGLDRLKPLFQPLQAALLTRDTGFAYTQADETRWMVFIDLDGHTEDRWPAAAGGLSWARTS